MKGVTAMKDEYLPHEQIPEFQWTRSTVYYLSSWYDTVLAEDMPDFLSILNSYAAGVQSYSVDIKIQCRQTNGKTVEKILAGCMINKMSCRKSKDNTLYHVVGIVQQLSEKKFHYYEMGIFANGNGEIRAVRHDQEKETRAKELLPEFNWNRGMDVLLGAEVKLNSKFLPDGLAIQLSYQTQRYNVFFEDENGKKYTRCHICKRSKKRSGRGNIYEVLGMTRWDEEANKLRLYEIVLAGDKSCMREVLMQEFEDEEQPSQLSEVK